MREAMVTRTIKSTICKVLCINIETQETVVEEITIPKTYNDDKALMKAVSKAYDEDGVKKALFVQSKEVATQLYGMTEIEFISKAKVLPPRTKEEA